MITISGDRNNPLVRLASKITRRFPALKRYFYTDFWDGYKLIVRLGKGRFS